MEKIGRKLYHMLGGLLLAGIYAWLGRTPGLITLSAMFVSVTALDLARLKNPAVNAYFFRRFPKFIRESEREKLTGTPPYVLGILLTLLLFSFPVALHAIVFLACGDVAATTVGERWGSIKLFGTKKSLQGTLAFIAAAILAGLLANYFSYLDPALIIAGAFVAAGVEIIPLRLDDNLTVPLASGGAMQLCAFLLLGGGMCYL